MCGARRRCLWHAAAATPRAGSGAATKDESENQTLPKDHNRRKCYPRSRVRSVGVWNPRPGGLGEKA